MVAAVRLKALVLASAKVGIKEVGVNRGALVDAWNTKAGAPLGSPWCCAFVHAMFAKLGVTLPGGASVSALLAAARSRGWIVARPRRGDLACFDFNEGDPYGKFGDHIGFVERVLALRWDGKTFTGWVQTVEGNTSSGLAGSQSEGGGVYRRRRWLRGISAEFVRVP